LAKSVGLLFLMTIGFDSLDPLLAVFGETGVSKKALNFAESLSKKKLWTLNMTLSTYAMSMG
jgi:hypothetical protein